MGGGIYVDWNKIPQDCDRVGCWTAIFSKGSRGKDCLTEVWKLCGEMNWMDGDGWMEWAGGEGGGRRRVHT